MVTHNAPNATESANMGNTAQPTPCRLSPAATANPSPKTSMVNGMTIR